MLHRTCAAHLGQLLGVFDDRDFAACIVEDECGLIGGECRIDTDAHAAGPLNRDVGDAPLGPSPADDGHAISRFDPERRQAGCHTLDFAPELAPRDLAPARLGTLESEWCRRRKAHALGDELRDRLDCQRIDVVP